MKNSSAFLAKISLAALCSFPMLAGANAVELENVQITSYQLGVLDNAPTANGAKAAPPATQVMPLGSLNSLGSVTDLFANGRAGGQGNTDSSGVAWVSGRGGIRGVNAPDMAGTNQLGGPDTKNAPTAPASAQNNLKQLGLAVHNYQPIQKPADTGAVKVLDGRPGVAASSGPIAPRGLATTSPAGGDAAKQGPLLQFNGARLKQ